MSIDARGGVGRQNGKKRKKENNDRNVRLPACTGRVIRDVSSSASLASRSDTDRYYIRDIRLISVSRFCEIRE